LYVWGSLASDGISFKSEINSTSLDLFVGEGKEVGELRMEWNEWKVSIQNEIEGKDMDWIDRCAALQEEEAAMLYY
jgi:hypothetical protein